MAEASTSSEHTSSEHTPKSGQAVVSRSASPQADGPLQTERGQTTIADTVVTKVAGMAAREVRGVHELGGGMARALAGVTQRVGVGDERSQGVTVEVGEREAAVDLTVMIEYGESIPRVSQAIRDNVIKRIEGITGLSVTEVNVSVNDLYFPGDDLADESPRVQ
ncbi:MAG: Asp23/Gls24 family envelope stress response protein [Actinomycetota bacterium]|nr:Asp23/Gls24 family envelope stress response protein [Actinomycetota bacterium]